MHRVDLMRVFLLLVVLTMLENTTAIAAVDNTSPALQQALGLQERGVELLNQKKYKQALEAFKKSTPILEKTAGKQHLTTATSYYLQASCCSILNEWSEALIYYHKAANIYEINKHSSADKIYNLLSVFYYKNNEYKKAIPVLKKALLSHQEKNDFLIF